MKRAVSLLGSLVALLCLGFFAYALERHWSRIGDIAFGAEIYAAMAIATALYLATYVTGARSWQLVLRSLGEPIGYRLALGILSVSQFAKYLPGNVGHHFGRVMLSRRAGVRTDNAIASIGLDTVLAVSAAAVCALASAHLLPGIAARYGFELVRNLVIVGSVLAAIALIAMSSKALQRHAIGAMRRCGNLLAVGNRRRSAMAWVQYLMSFALGAVALGAVGAGLGSDLPPIASLIGIYAAAWLTGFLVPGAPAGLGVREALLVLGLSPLLGQDVATAATALFRIVTVAGDGIAFALGWAVAGREFRRKANTNAGLDVIPPLPGNAQDGRNDD